MNNFKFTTKYTKAELVDMYYQGIWARDYHRINYGYTYARMLFGDDWDGITPFTPESYKSY